MSQNDGLSAWCRSVLTWGFDWSGLDQDDTTEERVKGTEQTMRPFKANKQCFRCKTKISSNWTKCCQKHTPDKSRLVVCDDCHKVLHPELFTDKSPLKFTRYVRKPFEIEAIQITMENIEEIAPMVGTLKTDERSTYIEVDSSLVPNMARVLPGYFLTRMGENIRCYGSKVFLDQFVEKTVEIEGWVLYMSRKEVSKSG